MAAQPLLNLLITPTSANALPITVQAVSGVPAVTIVGVAAAFSQLQGSVDASNRLLVRIV